MNDHYKNYSTEDLVTDEAFIEWVLDGDSGRDQIWKSWMMQNPEMETRIAQARDLIQQISIKKIDMKDSADHIWSRIQNDLQSQPASKARNAKTIRIMVAITIAASLLLLVITQITGSGAMIIQAEPGMATTHLLPDESVVDINDGSEIKYDSKDFKDSRLLQLNGEAFFQVTKGSTFTVRTRQGDVQVLGTSFNINSHNDQLNVICKTGKVKVSNSTSEVILIAGETASLTVQRNLIKHVEKDDVQIKWLEGIFEYQEAQLIEIAQELERQFDIEILIPDNLKNTLYTGFFLDDDLDKALSTVFWPLKLNFEKKEHQVIISR